ncbi:MAG: hypothetical protein KGD60_15015 [Candidatus Thorarchaeota archaeon]|nr:hypothetical protein [Candidatus Thorarchaeota archaeon]
MEYKWIRVELQTHSDAADMASILNLSHVERNASMGDAVRIAVTEWLKRNMVLLKKVQVTKAEVGST